MTTIHLVTSVFVGGQTGKSTHALMLMAYLCRPNISSKVVALVDLSDNAVMYGNLRNLFGRPHEGRIIGHPSFICRDENQSAGHRLFVIKPNRYLEGRQEILEFFNTVRSAIADYPDIEHLDHIICETNLPSDALTSTGFLDDFKGGRQSSANLYLWTTWIALSMTDKRQYDSYYTLMHGGDRNRIFYVHNPFPSNVGCPDGDISESMLECHRLALDRDYNALEMWSQCGFLVSTTKPDDVNEKLWEKAYSEFRGLQKRPENLLPVFMRSKLWQQANLSHFQLNSEAVSSPYDLCRHFNNISNKIYSLVFESYFLSINLE